MKNFLVAWLTVIVLCLVAVFIISALNVGGTWLLFLLMTALVAGVIVVSASLSDRIETLENEIQRMKAAQSSAEAVKPEEKEDNTANASN